MRRKSQYAILVSEAWAVLAGSLRTSYARRMRRTIPAALALLLVAGCGGAPENDSVPAPAAGRTDVPPPVQGNDAPLVQPAPALPTGAPVAPGPWLPAIGTHQARAMAIAAPLELQQLTARMQAAMQANPEWSRTYLAQHPGGALPWHPSLGISEQEHRRFHALTLQLGLTEIDRVALTVSRRPDGGLALAATGQAAPLNGIIVYPDRDRVETPRGALTIRSTIDNREPRSPSGPWQGVQWRSAPGGERTVKLAFGRRARGDLILYYDFGPSDAETIVLLFPAATAVSPQ